MDDVSKFGMISCASLVPVLAAFAVYCATEPKAQAARPFIEAVMADEEPVQQIVMTDAPATAPTYSKMKKKKSRHYIVLPNKRRIDCVMHPFQCKRYEDMMALRAQEPEAPAASASTLRPGTLTQPTSSTPQIDPAKVMTFSLDTTFSD